MLEVSNKWCMLGFQSHGGNVRKQLQLKAVERWCLFLSFFPLFFSHFSAMFAPLLDWQNRIGACVPTWEEKIWQLGRKETKIAYFPIWYCKEKFIWICPNSFIYLHINHDSDSEPGIFTKNIFKVRSMLSPYVKVLAPQRAGLPMKKCFLACTLALL